jgi:hypothetical protein
MWIPGTTWEVAKKRLEHRIRDGPVAVPGPVVEVHRLAVDQQIDLGVGDARGLDDVLDGLVRPVGRRSTVYRSSGFTKSFSSA